MDTVIEEKQALAAEAQEQQPPKITTCTVQKDNLAEALKIASTFLARRSTLPVLSSYHLSADSGRLVVSATNLEAYARVYIGAFTDEDFAIAAPGKLTDVIALLNGRIDLAVNHNNLPNKINAKPAPSSTQSLG